MELDFTEYITSWKRRREKYKETIKAEMDRALKEAQKASLLLARKYGVKKIVLFGSLAIGKYKRSSDIDLAVEGLKKESYIEALVEVERFTGMSFDIKLMEECKGFLKGRITKEGKILYEG